MRSFPDRKEDEVSIEPRLRGGCVLWQLVRADRKGTVIAT
jgi:hypothetical protein